MSSAYESVERLIQQVAIHDPGLGLPVVQSVPPVVQLARMQSISRERTSNICSDPYAAACCFRRPLVDQQVGA